MGQGHQHKPQPQQDHRPRHGPRQQPLLLFHLPTLYFLSTIGVQPPSAKAFGWVTGGVWLSTAHPSCKEQCRDIVFLSPMPGPRDLRQYSVLWYLISRGARKAPG